MKTRFIMGLMLALLSSGPLWAQEADPLTLNLKSEKTGAKATALGEFQISLDSPVLSDDLELSASDEAANTESSRFFFPAADLESLSNAPRFFLMNREAPDPLRRKETKVLKSTLTLTAIYLQDEFGRTGNAPQLIGARKRIGRWAVYGEIDGSKTPPALFPTTGQPPRETPQILLNVLSSDQVVKPLVSDTPSVDGTDVPQVSNYYLEATYDFHSDVKGRVSYERSRQDVLDDNEKLQVEGIVKTSPDTLIKAGFRNQIRTPEVGERKPSNNKRIWTEFILKF